MKNLLLIADGAEGGGGNELAQLISRLAALDGRVAVIEKSKDTDKLIKRLASLEESIKVFSGLDDKIAELELKLEELAKAKALPMTVRVEQPRIKSTNDHFREELAELESNPEKRIALMMEGGV